MSAAAPMDLRKNPLEYVGISFYGGRLDLYEIRNGHTRLTPKQNKRYWKKQRQLLGKLCPGWERDPDMEFAGSRGKQRPTPRQRKPRRA